jgi:membrane-bound inhibitor of C-type lysozyme
MTQRAAKSATALVAVAALMAGCSREAAAPPAQPQAPAPTAVQTPPAPPIGYACESGKTVVVQYPDTSTAQLTYNGQTYALRTVQAASGARYAGLGRRMVDRDPRRSGERDPQPPRPQSGCRRGHSGAVQPSGLGPVDTPVGSDAPTPAPGGVLPAALPCKGTS